MSGNRITVMLTINSMIIGGAEQQFLELVKGLNKERFKVIVVTLYPGGPLESVVKSIPDIEYICLNRKSKYNLFTIFTILRLLRKKHVDVVQPFLTPATFYTLVPAVIGRTPVKVVTERSGLRKKTSLGHEIYLRTEDFFSRFAEWVIPNSESGRNFLIKRGINPDRTRVIYNGINLDRLNPDPVKINQIRSELGIPPDSVVVGITATLTPAKDHVTFLKAAKIISRSIPRARFALLGDGPLRNDLEQTARELGIEKKVMFLGNQIDVGSYISIFDIACLCSVDLEGCSNATLEAMALGKPAVVTDIGGNRELVENGKTGLLIPVRDPQSLANAVISIINQPERTAEIARQAKEMIMTRFSLKRMVHDYEVLYEETIRDGKSRKNDKK